MPNIDIAPRLVTIRRGGQMPMAGRRFADIKKGDHFLIENDPPSKWESGWMEAMQDPTCEDGVHGIVCRNLDADSRE